MLPFNRGHTRAGRWLLPLLLAGLLAACPDDDPVATGSPDSSDIDTMADSTADVAILDVHSDTAGGEDGSPDIEDVADDSSATDLDSSAGDTEQDNTEQDSGGLAPYLENCDSLFSARILERQMQERAGFTGDCDSSLEDTIPLANDELACAVGESANGCWRRLYETPPSTRDLGIRCAGGENCLVAAWIARCADGSDDCAEDEAICVDGSRPLVWAEGATRGDSDRWLFFMGGEGDPCTGASCWVDYRYGQLQNAATPRAMSTTHPDHATTGSQTGSGVMNGTDILANPFAEYNRVHFDRCGDAASTATVLVPVADGVTEELAEIFPGAPIRTRLSMVPVYNHGLDTWRALFHTLANGDGLDLDGDDSPDLPLLSDASTVVLVGGSDASVWLVHAVDELTRELRTIAGDDVDVRLVIDGFFEPMLDNEARYHLDAPESFDLFTHPYGETGLCALPEGLEPTSERSCSSANYLEGSAPGNFLRTAMDIRGVIRDESCAADHGAESAECTDKLHTLLQHVSTPFLVLADQEDRTISGLAPNHADDRTYRWTLDAYRQRVLDQSSDIMRYWHTDAREEGPGAEGMAALILVKARREGQGIGAATHVRAGDDERMLLQMTRCDRELQPIVSATLAELMHAWITGSAPTSFVIEDADAREPESPFWVTGQSCREPE